MDGITKLAVARRASASRRCELFGGGSMAAKPLEERKAELAGNRSLKTPVSLTSCWQHAPHSPSWRATTGLEAAWQPGWKLGGMARLQLAAVALARWPEPYTSCA